MIPKGSQDLQAPGFMQASINDKTETTKGRRDVDPSDFQMAVGHIEAKHNPLIEF